MTFELTEKEWARQLFETRKGLASTLGWTRVYHVFRSRNSPAGFPDWVCVRDRIIYVELKAGKNKPSAAQVEWLTDLAKAGGEVYLWWPADLEDAGRALTARSFQHDNPTRWTAGGCRMDQLEAAA